MTALDQLCVAIKDITGEQNTISKPTKKGALGLIFPEIQQVPQVWTA